MKRILLFYILSLLAFPGISYSQKFITTEEDSVVNPSHLMSVTNKKIKQKTLEKSNISVIKFSSITGFTIGAGVWLHNYQRNSWWAGQRGQFHIQNDWDYALSADKAGHFFDGAFIHKLYSGAFEWTGFSKKTSMWLGTLFSIAYMTDIEIEDGFARDWGFSPGDELFNVLGAFYPVVQNAYEPLNEFNFKWSYYPSRTLTEGIKNGAFLDDYDGQTMWLSIGVHRFLPEPIKKYWPDFFNIAVGYGVKDHIDVSKAYQNWYIALDYDFRKMIPGSSKFMLWLKDVLNHFRILPAPGIRFSKHGTEYIINF
ncbi:MAG: DUF2279 domain-containing protein [Ignavibacteriae bacterium]|nr:MAG: DUF2279 domain-containing protein [Ignavibacteriota bacterium]